MPAVNRLTFESPEQRQAQWNEISTRNLLREQGANLIAVITDRVKSLEAALQADETLAVYCDAVRNRIRVQRFEFRTWHLAIVCGLDEEGNQAHRIENVQDVKLTCKIIKSGKKSNPIGFALPSDSK